VDSLEKYKDATYMGELFIKVIEEISLDSYVQPCLQGSWLDCGN
jgi:hypothetical protein